jgi:mono/diheme cytochrome c family protein
VLGRRDSMPAFSAPANLVWDGPTAHLSDAQVADVVNYLRSHFGNPYKDGVTASEVAKLPHPATAAAP